MRSKERRLLLINELLVGEVNVEQLAERFEVSASTIRRDLQSLAKNGHVQRTYGGAILSHTVPEVSFVERIEHNGDKKRAIARSALDFIRDGDTVFLDAGSTICALGRLLADKKIRIITNNLMLMPILDGSTDIELIILGGKCRTTSMGTFGSLALEALRHMTADYLFTSADGVVVQQGLCEASIEQTVLKQAMIARANHTIVLADSSKINRAEQHAWAQLPASCTLISDSAMNDQHKADFEAEGVKVIRAKK